MGHCAITLEGVSKVLQGRKWDFEHEVLIGRVPSADLHLEDPSVSRKHATVAPTYTGWVVHDLGSPNGTFINGIRLGTTAHRLRPGDLLQCGALTLRVLNLVHESPPRPGSDEPTNVEVSGVAMTIESVARRSWEQGLQTLNDQQHRQRQGKHFLTLLQSGYHLSRVNALEEMLQVILEDTAAVLNAERGAVVLVDPATGELSARAVWPAGRRSSADKVFSRTLVQRCLEKKESTHCMRADLERLLEESDSGDAGTMASTLCAVLRTPQQCLGVLYLQRGLLQDSFHADDLQLADAIAATISLGVENALRIEREQRQSPPAAELHDPSAAAHNERVTAYALLIAEELKLSAEDIRLLQIAAPLHDIGKLAVPNAVLGKCESLDDLDLDQLRAHTVHGADMVSSEEGLTAIAPIIRSHHERWDGQGYPDGLSGGAIPLLARIVAVAEAFDVMTTAQPYRRPISVAEAWEELRSQAGKQFDPKCVEALLRCRAAVEQRLCRSCRLERIRDQVSMESAVANL